jgi:3-methyl-2-oxobutanoate hydroxymethyltransferase
MSTHPASPIASLPNQKLTESLTLTHLKQMSATQNERLPIACVALYDATSAYLADRAGVDVILVGDSLGMLVQGHGSTLPVSVSDMIYHTSCVYRGLRHQGHIQRAWVIADLPFGSYPTPEKAFESSVLLMQAGAQMVKLEGGAMFADHVQYLVSRGIPVCAHVGLTPQSVNVLGGYRVQGKTQEAAARMLNDIQVLEQAGAAMVVLEAIPSQLTEKIKQQTSMITIGIGAGLDCSGQVLVLHDLLGMTPHKIPKFAKNFLVDLPEPSVESALKAYVNAVKTSSFPAPIHEFK